MQSSRTLFRLGLVLCLLLAPAALFAQGFQVGNLSGTVVDESGGVLPGVTVEATSQERGTSRVEVTGQAGEFRFNQLPIGTYTVEASLGGFQTRTIRGNRVQSDRTTNVTVTLLLTATETITVTGEAPIVDRTNASVQTTISSDQFDKVPVGRSYQTLVNSAPGVTGGANPTVNGALSSSNVYLFDGVDATDTTTGTFAANLNFEAIEEMSIFTAGASAEYGRATGAIVNVITKSGTNDFEGSAKLIMTNDDWDSQNKTKNPLTGASFARDKNDLRTDNKSATLGGPLWRDRAWFFGAYEWRDETRGPVQLPFSLDTYSYTIDVTLENYRVTGQLTPSQNLWVKHDTDPITGFLVRYGNPAEVEALTVQGQLGERWAGQYTGLIGNNLAFEAMYGTSEGTILVRPNMFSPLDNGAVHFDLTTGRYFNGAFFDGFVHRPRDQAVGALTYFTNLGGNNHEFKAGLDWQELNSSNLFGPQNGQLFIDRSFDWENRTYVPLLRRDYVVEPSTSVGEIMALYLLDRFEVGDRFFLEAGVRFEQQDGHSDIGETTVDTSVVAPRLAGSYDIFGNGRTMARATYGQFYQSIIQDFSDNFGAVPQYANFTEYLWNAATQQWDLRRTVDVGGSSLQANLDLKPTYHDEITLGIQQQLGPVMGVGARLIWREWNDIQDDIEDFDAAGNTTLAFVNNPQAEREYRGLQLQFEKRFANNWSALANYSFAKAEGNHYSTYASALMDYQGQNCAVRDEAVGVVPCSDVMSPNRLFGNQTTDQDQAGALFTYSRPVGPVNVAVGTTFSWSEGIRFARNQTAVVLDDEGGQTSELYTFFYDPPGSDQLGSFWTANVALEVTVPIFNLVDLGFKAEAFNVTDEQKQTGLTSSLWCEDASATCATARERYGHGLSRGAYQTPRSYRITALLRF